MFLIVILVLVIGAGAGWGIGYLRQKGKDPKALLGTADTVLDGVKDANDTFGKLLPAPVELIIDKVLKTAQAGVHAAQQLCDSSQLTEGQRNQEAFDIAMNLLKLEGYQPTPELEEAVKSAIETGVFVMKNIVKPIVGSPEPLIPVVETTISDQVNADVGATEAVVPDSVAPDTSIPVVHAEAVAPVTPAVQSVIDAATLAGQAAYQQVLQDSIQALSVTK